MEAAPFPPGYWERVTQEVEEHLRLARRQTAAMPATRPEEREEAE
jgi:hypothetical protein